MGYFFKGSLITGLGGSLIGTFIGGFIGIIGGLIGTFIGGVGIFKGALYLGGFTLGRVKKSLTFL
tara:strand:+ start:4346 stop:4540 length:195 start_codon:yes stop_codon:yes gene_type:complete